MKQTDLLAHIFEVAGKSSIHRPTVDEAAYQDNTLKQKRGEVILEKKGMGYESELGLCYNAEMKAHHQNMAATRYEDKLIFYSARL